MLLAMRILTRNECKGPELMRSEPKSVKLDPNCHSRRVDPSTDSRRTRFAIGFGPSITIQFGHGSDIVVIILKEESLFGICGKRYGPRNNRASHCRLEKVRCS